MNVKATHEIDAPADTVWETIKHFDGLTRWAPGITECTMRGYGVGATRTVKTRDGQTFVERLDACDDGTRTLAYSMVEGPVPVRDYRSEISVSDSGDHCTVVWDASGEPSGIPEDQLETILSGICNGGVKALKTHCELQGTSQMRKLDASDM